MLNNHHNVNDVMFLLFTYVIGRIVEHDVVSGESNGDGFPILVDNGLIEAVCDTFPHLLSQKTFID